MISFPLCSSSLLGMKHVTKQVNMKVNSLFKSFCLVVSTHTFCSRSYYTLKFLKLEPFVVIWIIFSSYQHIIKKWGQCPNLFPFQQHLSLSTSPTPEESYKHLLHCLLTHYISSYTRTTHWNYETQTWHLYSVFTSFTKISLANPQKLLSDSCGGWWQVMSFLVLWAICFLLTAWSQNSLCQHTTA